MSGMKWIKKVASTPLSQVAKVVDSLTTQTNDRINAPSIRAVREALDISWDQVYPVGAIYMTVNSDDPSVLFGGTWQKIKDRFLLASGDTYSNGSTGGSANHTPQGTVGNTTLTVNQIPSHTHELLFKTNKQTALSGTGNTVYGDTVWEPYEETGATGGGQPHNHSFAGTSGDYMPPYLVVNVWTRVA